MITTQLLFNIIVSASIICLIALGLTLQYKVIGFINFAFAALCTFGAYLAMLFNKILFMALETSILLAIMSVILIGCLNEIIIFKPIRKKMNSINILLFCSLGIYIVLQNILSMAFGDNVMTFNVKAQNTIVEIYGAQTTPAQIVILSVSSMLVVLTATFLKYSSAGKQMRAVANDTDLAKISGIDSGRIILLSFALSSAFAGTAGILVAFDVDVTPTMGMNYLMMGVVALIIGGTRNIWGIVFGSLLIASAKNLGAWYINSQWQDAIAFVILLVFLLFKPEGFFGSKIKKVAI